MSGIRDPKLDAVRIPAGFEYLWRWFSDLRAGCMEGMSGTHITWQDISHWQALRGIAMDAFELDAIMQMDAEIRAWNAERAAQRSNHG